MISDVEKEPAVHDQVLVEAQIDERIVGFRAVVVNVQPNALWLGLARPDPLLERLGSNQPLHLTFRRDTAAVVADSAFKSHLGVSRSRLFAVERPSMLQLVQRRAHLRLDVERIVQVRVDSHSESGPAGRIGSGTTRNISAGGLQFITDLAVAVGDELEITIVLGPNDVVPAEAQVVRVEDAHEVCPDAPQVKRAAPGQLKTVAARFLSISEMGQDRIVRHIFSVQRQRKEGKPA